MNFRSSRFALHQKNFKEKILQSFQCRSNDCKVRTFSCPEQRAGFNRAVLCVLMLLIFSFELFSSNYDNILLKEIADKIATYRNKEITLRLKFKSIDYTFDKISFYDRKNIDIVFDISNYKKGKIFKERKLNLHEGMEYIVSFTVKDAGNSGEILGDLIDFTPLAIFELPEGDKKSPQK